MDILLIAATSFEIQPTIDLQTAKPDLSASHRLSGLVTGLGSVSTTWALMRQIGRHRPALIVQAGIAGCFSPGQLGKTVVVSTDSMADLGVWEDDRFKTIADLQLVDKNAPPFTEGLLVNPHRQLLAKTSLPQVSAITVNEITTNTERISWYQQNIDPFVESMEGAALHYIGLQENIPFLQIRSVSNDIGVRDKTKWDIRGAIASLNATLNQILPAIIEL